MPNASTPTGVPTLYGLTASNWTGPRWLDNVAPHDDGSAEEDLVWLTHAHDRWLFTRTSSWACVGSTGLTASTIEGSTVERDLARAGLMLLLGGFEATQRFAPWAGARTWGRAYREVVQPRVAQFDSWDLAQWQIDDRTVPARFTHFVGAWVGVATTRPDSAIVVIATGMEPDAVRLTTQTDGAAYHADLSQPLTQKTYERAMRLALGDALVDEAPPHDDTVHPDLRPSIT